MENQVTCPHCQRKITNNPVIEDVVQNKGSVTQSLVCECGERITYWQIAAQLREQKKIGIRIQNWFRGLFKSQN